MKKPLQVLVSYSWSALQPAKRNRPEERLDKRKVVDFYENTKEVTTNQKPGKENSPAVHSSYSVPLLDSSHFVTSSLTIGATSVPNSSMAFITSPCGIVPTGTCSIKRVMPTFFRR